ncbi:FH1 FH2 domain-containing 3-like protein [Labeo rohita]|uniref:FH1 FH2 domain-containing 3-like protein n=1 Tax=Labeo rohita TaxID=84645 RepID=A0A498ME88_LABRO|nr:FH1 FH2 domain-containing 3-like protein [Labeo rohita]
MLDDCALQLSHNGSYLDLESTLAEQRDELEGFQEDGGRGKKHSIILRTQLSVRVHACIVTGFAPNEITESIRCLCMAPYDHRSAFSHLLF